MGTPRFLTEGKTPEEWAGVFAARGISISPRTLREHARRLGACGMLGNAMIILPEHIDQIFGDEAREPDPETLTAILRDALVSLSPVDRLMIGVLLSEELDGNIYFLRCSDRIKIGYAKDVHRRLDTIRAGASSPIELVAALPGSRRLEHYIHVAFADLRRHGEWFEDLHPLSPLVSALENAS